MNCSREEYAEFLSGLLRKNELFSEADLFRIKSIPTEVLTEFLDSTVKMNHFRLKYFNSQHEYFTSLNRSSQDLDAMVRKKKGTKPPQQRKKKDAAPRNLPVFDTRLDFLDDISKATPAQLGDALLAEEMRRGINLREAPAPEAPQPQTPQLDEYFGEIPVSNEDSFNPRGASTPFTSTNLRPLPVAIPDTIPEESLSVRPSAADPAPGEEAIPQRPTDQISHTPPLPPPVAALGSATRRALPGSVDQPIVAQEAPDIMNDQPDFEALRAEARRRYILCSPAPMPPPPRSRRMKDIMKPLVYRNFTLPTQEEAPTEAELQRFLCVSVVIPRHHIYTRPGREEPASDTSNTGTSIAKPLQILGSQRSIPLPPAESSSLDSSALPTIHGSAELQPNSAQLRPGLAEISELPEDPVSIPVIQDVDAGALIQLNPPDILPDFSANAADVQNLSVPQQERPQTPPMLSDEVIARAEKLLRLLHQRDELSPEDVKAEFPSRLLAIGAFQTLLMFNGKLWRMEGEMSNWTVKKLPKKRVQK